MRLSSGCWPCTRINHGNDNLKVKVMVRIPGTAVVVSFNNIILMEQTDV